MNYIIEGNINFFSELKKELDIPQEETNSKENEECCLITHEPLDINNIALTCGHKFNYVPLYNEVINQKNYNALETTGLSLNQIKCPYCRTITNKLLPYIEHSDITYKRGVNYPLKYCMKLHSCQWLKQGNNNNPCGKDAYKSEFGTYCCNHQKLCKQKLYKQTNKTINQNSLTKQHIDLSKKYKIAELKQILRDNNKRIGGTKPELIDRIINHNIVLII